MELTYIAGEVENNRKKVSVKFLLDSGINYTVLPKSVWKEINLKPKR